MTQGIRWALMLAASASLLLADAMTTGLAGDASPELICPPAAKPRVMRPELLCAFDSVPPDAPFPLHDQVYSTPLVFRATPPGGGPRESFVAAVFSAPLEKDFREDDGVLRILRARDCSLVATLGGGPDPAEVPILMVSPFNIAAADLTGDGNPEIIAARSTGSILAWTSVDGEWQAEPLWEAPRPENAHWSACNPSNSRCSLGWGGISVHDLDDDGSPEIIRDGVVFGANGALLGNRPAGYGLEGATDSILSQGHFPMLADLDNDGLVEITDGKGMWEWTGLLLGWQPQPGFVSEAAGSGHTAIGNVLQESGEASPELAVVRRTEVQFLSMDGSSTAATALLGPLSGSPPVLADVDGDGLLEVAVSGTASITLYDPDCGPSPRAGGSCSQGLCLGKACPDGVAWSRPVQDSSSGTTPAIAFDFEGDGASEVVMADECFTRAFDAAGDVVFSRHRSSCTWMESPVIAAIDDTTAKAALIVPSNTACGPIGTGFTCPMIDPLYRGQACTENSDCDSGTCDAGLCRCASSAECCSAGDSLACEASGYTCGTPNEPVAGSGMTCLASRPGGSAGIAIHTDPRWARARPIWNQPAFAVTHVDDEGSVPATTAWQANWQLDSDGYRSTPSLPEPCIPVAVFSNGFEE